MDNIVALILANIAIPGAVTGVAIAALRRSSLAGSLADLILGAAGGIAGGLVILRILARMNVVAASSGAWVIWVASALGAVVVIAIVRSIARTFGGEGDAETAL